jgi:hypothetical protein
LTAIPDRIASSIKPPKVNKAICISFTLTIFASIL